MQALFVDFVSQMTLKPCPNARTRGEESGKKNSSVRPNLTDLVEKQVCVFQKRSKTMKKHYFGEPCVGLRGNPETVLGNLVVRGTRWISLRIVRTPSGKPGWEKIKEFENRKNQKCYVKERSMQRL